MNRDQINGYFSKPLDLPASAVNDLPELIKRYPYFQGAHALLARALKQENDLRFDEALKDAAVHCPDRARLFELIHVANDESYSSDIERQTPKINPDQPELTENQQEEERVPETGTTLPEEAHDQPEMNTVLGQEPLPTEQELFNEILRYPEIGNSSTKELPEILPETNANEQHSFFEWLDILSGNTAKTEKTTSKGPPSKSKSELIEQFILAEPKISRPVKAEFFSPVSTARRSIEDRHEIVTETLARIYEDQGNKEKAIQIYQKLSLQDPVKSSYFAALIEKLENQA